MKNVFLVAVFFAAVVNAVEIPSPSPAGAAHPHLVSTADGRLLMSWTEPVGEKHAIRFAEYRNGAWSAPRTIVERSDLFVNWADFPSIDSTSDGTLFAHWLQKNGAGKYAYDVHVASSRDRGATWSASKVIHRDGKAAEHGFVSLVPVSRNAIGAVWLDGRQMTGEEGEMTLRYARVTPAGAMANESLLDARVCECCTTAMAMTSAGPVIAYRDRTADEIRDISIVRWSNGSWTKPAPLHADGWKINGCPVNGPQIDARGKRVVVAWFTAANDKEQINVAFSSDAGAKFSAPVRIDAGKPSGRVDVLWVDAKTAVVAWLEGMGDGAYIAHRRIAIDGTLGPIVKIAGSSSARSSGFPRMAILGGEIFIAWTEVAPVKKIRVVKF